VRGGTREGRGGEVTRLEGNVLRVMAREREPRSPQRTPSSNATVAGSIGVRSKEKAADDSGRLVSVVQGVRKGEGRREATVCSGDDTIAPRARARSAAISPTRWGREDDARARRMKQV
jgi:hypothetical protein